MENEAIQKQEPDDDAETSLSIEAYQFSRFSGPLPHPAVLHAYEEIQPGSAERFMCWVEEESVHRRQLELIRVKSESNRSTMGIVFAFIVSVLFIGCGTYLIDKGRSVEGFGVIGTGTAALCGVFVYGSINRKKERIEKAKILAADLKDKMFPEEDK